MSKKKKRHTHWPPQIPDSLINASFFTKKAGSFSGVPQRTLQSWTERGLVIPDIADTTGTGSKRLYSMTNIIEIGIIKALTDERISLSKIRVVMEHLRGEAGKIEYFQHGEIGFPSDDYRSPLEWIITQDNKYLIIVIDIELNEVTADIMGYMGDELKPPKQFLANYARTTMPPEWAKVLILNLNGIIYRIVEAVE